MKVHHIVESMSEEAVSKVVKNILMMFYHNNGVSVKIDVVQRELRKHGIQISEETIEEIASEVEYQVANGEIIFPSTSGEVSDPISDAEVGEYEVETPAEQKAREATRSALKKK